MTNTMSVETAREVLGQNVQTFTIFAQYVNDIGIGIHLIEAMTSSMYETVTDSRTLLAAALQDIEPGREQSVMDGMVDGAASLQFLVRFARMVESTVFPPVFIPSEKAVDAALVLFHDAKQSVAVS